MIGSTAPRSLLLLSTRLRLGSLGSKGRCRRALSSTTRYEEKRAQKGKEIEEFAEVRAVRAFSEQLRSGACVDRHAEHGAMPALLDVASGDEVRQALQAGFATFCLHAEARVAAVSDWW